MPCVADADLMLCDGVAYQADMTCSVAYDEAYYAKCQGYEGQTIAERINAGRIALVDKHYGSGCLLDVGIGSGEFIKRRPGTFGFDVNPVAIEWLKRNDLWADRLDHWGAMSFWDVLEHLPEPETYLKHLWLHSFLFASLPVFDDLARVRESRHYRPGEHLYYFTERGFTEWMGRHGFLLLDVQSFETEAGRDNIKSFAFKRVAWPRAPK